MRVLQITAFSGWGCTGRIAVGINNALVAKGYESVVAWGRTNTAPESVATIQIGNHRDQQLHGLYTRITDKCGFGSKKATREFLKKIDECMPDLIQLHIMHGYYINLDLLFDYVRKHNIPVVWTFHDCWAFTGHCPYFDMVNCEKWKTGCHHCEQKAHHPTSWLLDNSEWNWKKKKELYADYDRLTVVTPSKWLKGLVQESFFKHRNIQVIHNGINLNDFRPVKGNFRQKNQIEDKRLILGVSSTWAKSKGLNDFLQLSELLPKDYVIVLVGLTGEQKRSLPKQIIGIERTDSVRELSEIYTTADVFINPTYEDNFPTTNLEALACGTPVVTYNTGGSVEAAGNDFGKVVEQGNIDGLCQYILSEEWKKIGSDSCVRRALEFEETKKFNEYVKLYETIIYNRK